MVRGLCKDVVLAVLGGAAPVNRAALARIKDSLIQLLRNAVDHGIKTPAERVLAGNALAATILHNGRDRGRHGGAGRRGRHPQHSPHDTRTADCVSSTKVNYVHPSSMSRCHDDVLKGVANETDWPLRSARRFEDNPRPG